MVQYYISRYFWKFVACWLLVGIALMVTDKYGFAESGNYAFLFSFNSSSSIETQNRMFENFPLNWSEFRKLFPSDEPITSAEFTIFGFFVFIFPIPFIWWSHVVYAHALLGAPLWDWQFSIFFQNENSSVFRPGKTGIEWGWEIFNFLFYQLAELEMTIIDFFGASPEEAEPRPRDPATLNSMEKFWTRVINNIFNWIESWFKK